MRSIAVHGVHEMEIQRSRFICSLARVAAPDDAAAFIASIKKQHWSASHNCSAFRVGPNADEQRSSDDGEPAGTAGVPMLEVLTRRDITDTVAVVTRYYGGIVSVGWRLTTSSQPTSEPVAWSAPMAGRSGRHSTRSARSADLRTSAWT
jgi:putative IMPACT (imprinted ancient) family translation regulator